MIVIKRKASYSRNKYILSTLRINTLFSSDYPLWSQNGTAARVLATVRRGFNFRIPAPPWSGELCTTRLDFYTTLINESYQKRKYKYKE